MSEPRPPGAPATERGNQLIAFVRDFECIDDYERLAVYRAILAIEQEAIAQERARLVAAVEGLDEFGASCAGCGCEISSHTDCPEEDDSIIVDDWRAAVLALIDGAS